MPNTSLTRLNQLSSFRKIAAVAWDAPRNPSIYGTLEIRAEPLLTWLDAQNQDAEDRLTVTHAVARAVAILLDRHRDLNAVVRWGQIYQRRDVDVFLQVLVRDPDASAVDKMAKVDLSGLVVRQADTKSIHEIAAEVRAGARRIRRGDDEDFQRTKGMADWLPPFLLRWMLRVLEFLQWGLNLDTSWLGAPPDPFGSAQVTSVGMLGIRLGHAPFFPLGRSPLLIMVGALQDAVVALDGQPVVQKMLTVNATLDHRVIDGYHAAVLSRELTHLLEHPEELEQVSSPA